MSWPEWVASFDRTSSYISYINMEHRERESDKLKCTQWLVSNIKMYWTSIRCKAANLKYWRYWVESVTFLLFVPSQLLSSHSSSSMQGAMKSPILISERRASRLVTARMLLLLRYCSLNCSKVSLIVRLIVSMRRIKSCFSRSINLVFVILIQFMKRGPGTQSTSSKSTNPCFKERGLLFNGVAMPDRSGNVNFLRGPCWSVCWSVCWSWSESAAESWGVFMFWDKWWRHEQHLRNDKRVCGLGAVSCWLVNWSLTQRPWPRRFV